MSTDFPLFFAQALLPLPPNALEDSLRDFLASKECSYIFVPIAFVVLGIVAKWLGRRDNDTAPHWNELAVGTSVAVMATGKIISDICASGARFAVLGSLAFFAFFVIFILAGIDRHFSWERTDSGTTNRKRIWLDR